MRRMHPLTSQERAVIESRGTEAPGVGCYIAANSSGVYACRRCESPLYLSSQKFASGCGWPSFDDELVNKVQHIPDRDGRRTELICRNCQGHLGHVFKGEGLTSKNVRHCVNSISLAFFPALTSEGLERAIVAGGCFWGVEYFMKKISGVRQVTSGYIGGNVVNPTYEEVCSGQTGHAEAVEITFRSEETSYRQILQDFFETHDPTQVNRQGPDIGSQYRSAVFYLTDAQRKTAEGLIEQLKKEGLYVATEVAPASRFYTAETYHLNYYESRGSLPYCHRKTPRKWSK